MPAVRCAICWNHYAIDSAKTEFLIFPCGHGFCTNCCNQLFSDRRAKCPNCRKSIQRREGHHVYLELIDSETMISHSVIEGLEKMNVDTPLVSVKKAGQKLERAARIASEESLIQLRKALKDFIERIIPGFTKLETQRKENDMLQHQLQESYQEQDALRSKLKDFDTITKETSCLKKSLEEADRSTEKAIRLAEQSNEELQRERRGGEQLRVDILSLKSENERLRDANEQYKTRAASDKERYKKLFTKYTMLKAQRLEAPHRPSDPPLQNETTCARQSAVNIDIPSSVQPSLPHSTLHLCLSDDVELDFQGVAPASFKSDWQFHSANDYKLTSHRRVLNPVPIALDRKGRPTKPVQLGPRTTIHVPR